MTADEAYRAGLDHPMAYLGTGRNRSWYFTTPPAPSPGEHEA